MTVSRRRFLQASIATPAIFALPAVASIRPAYSDRPMGHLVEQFEVFSGRAKQVMEIAAQQAAALGHWYVGSEHLLLALFAESESTGGDWLADLGVSLEELNCVVNFVVGSGEPGESSCDAGILTPTDNLISCLDNAVFAAREMGHANVSPEHMMIGIVESFGTTANLLLDEMWIERGSVRQVVEASQKNDVFLGIA